MYFFDLGLRDTKPDSSHNIFGNTLQVIRQTESRHNINELLHGINLQTHFTDRVIIGKGVMIVVEPFAPSCKRDPLVVSRFNLTIVWTMAEHVGSRIHEPCTVECNDVPTK